MGFAWLIACLLWLAAICLRFVVWVYCWWCSCGWLACVAVVVLLALGIVGYGCGLVVALGG